MDFSPEILRYEEKLIYNLRALYLKHGYKPFKLSRFEEYSLYAENKEFLPEGNIIAFTGAGGRLMAMRPDVTLSVVRGIKDDGLLKKLCYNENVYRTINGEPRELMQAGLECIGNIDVSHIGEVLMLAKQSLETLGVKTRLDISHMDFLEGLLNSTDLTASARADIIRCISGKNMHSLRKICRESGLSDAFYDNLILLASLYGPFSDIKNNLEKININRDTDKAICELAELDSILKNLGISEDINIDFSVTNNMTYYGGIIFHGFAEGIPSMVLSGGRYDKLLGSVGKSGGAIGFAVYPDLLSGLPDDVQPSPDSAADDIIGVALPKGRLGDQALELLVKAGYDCADAADVNSESRKLVFENPRLGIRLFWVKPSDVAVYVQRGAADIGVAGKDTLMETRCDVYELLDLKLGKCRLCTAGIAGEANKYKTNGHGNALRVATKFPNIARDFYNSRGQDIDVICLHGSIELAPLLGLSDVIVDIVETGRTLADNNMRPFETIEDISARLISNKVSYKFKYKKISKLCRDIEMCVNKRGN